MFITTEVPIVYTGGELDITGTGFAGAPLTKWREGMSAIGDIIEKRGGQRTYCPGIPRWRVRGTGSRNAGIRMRIPTTQKDWGDLFRKGRDRRQLRRLLNASQRVSTNYDPYHRSVFVVCIIKLIPNFIIIAVRRGAIVVPTLPLLRNPTGVWGLVALAANNSSTSD